MILFVKIGRLSGYTRHRDCVLRMSGAKCGYVDPSSTDKDAADATDEVELEVLCMTGREVGVTETSMQARRKDRRAACEWKADAG